MRIVVASDSFKGSLSSADIGVLVSEAARSIPSTTVVVVPMADGGEGTVEAVVAAAGGRLHHTSVAGPLGEPVHATWGMLSSGAAIIEMAAASGLSLVDPQDQNPLATTTYGTGELMVAALDAGATSITVALGGSATNDGGMGALSALGVRFFDQEGAVLDGCGANLSAVAHVDVEGLDRRIASGATPITVMCDVDNPLLGLEGASATFAPQKGATPADVIILESGMAHYVRVLAAVLGPDVFAAATASGAGAAGGLGFALSALLGAHMVPGVESVMDLISFEALLEGADLVITGEGRLDAQTAHGKVVSGVAKRCARAKVACVAVVGSVSPGVSREALGLAGIWETSPADMSTEEAMARAGELYAAAIGRVLATL